MRRSHPPHPKEGKTGDHQYPRGNPEEENRIHNLEKPRKIEKFSSCRRVEGTARPTAGPRTPELDHDTASGRATNDQIEHQKTPQRDRRPANRPRKRQGGAEARPSLQSSTHVVESPSKAAGYSLTPALDAEATTANLGYDRSN